MKYRILRLLLILTACIIGADGFSQSVDNYRITSIVVDSDIIKLDTLSIIPETFVVQNANRNQFRLDPITAELYIVDSTLMHKTLVCSYLTYSLDFSKPISHRSLDLLEPAHRTITPVSNTWSSVADIQDDDKLLTTGSISRGVSVGNSQDLVLNSSLNLQLVGKLSDDVDISAVISDKNVPIQPEGNTQTIYDINNIFLTINIKKLLRIDAGDIEIFAPKDDYLSYSRNLLGMKAQVRSSFGEKFKMVNSLGGGVAKGKFVRQSLSVSNGMQGPYKLYGEDGSVGIVVVAGSERVYVDGALLTRGQENDYTIDYNTAELTFTPNMLVSSEKRVIVEFEYTDKHYTRINLFSNNELSVNDRWSLHVNYYQEQDLKNQSIQPELSVEQKLFLSTMGDKERDCYYATADSMNLSADRVLYCKKDTLVDGILYSDIYQYSISDSVQLYALNFTYMGPNKGSYELLSSTANGRVFGWVAPEEGELRGSYEPVLLLSTPKLVQMATVAAEYKYGKDNYVRTELALSNYDQNTFSKLDDGDNVGFAYFVDLRHNQPLKSRTKDSTDWNFLSAVQWQFVHKNFHAVESFREVEFARNFNLSEDYSSSHSEQMLQAILGLSKSQISRSQYKLNWFSRLGDVSAIRNEFMSKNNFKGLQFDTRTSYLFTKDSLWKSGFWSSDNDLSYKFSKIEIGFADKLERNLFNDMRSDTLRQDSYAFNDALFFLKNRDSLLYQFCFSYKNRVEYEPEKEHLQQHQLIHELSARFQFDRIKNQHFSINAIYRNQRLHDSITQSSPEHYFVGKLEYTGRFWKNALILSTYYEAGSGMEQKRSFTFIKVAEGQGTYTWNDYNGNGIEEMDEFEIAAFQDEANYVKVWITGVDYVNTFNNQFTQSLQLRPAAVWNKQTGFRRFLARFQDVAQFRSQLKNARPNFNPFYTNLEDTNLVSRVLTFNNTLSFNNSASKFAADFIVQASQNKNLLYYGYEQNEVSLQQVVLKSTPCQQLFLKTAYEHRQTQNQSQLLSNRCYDIEQHQAEAMAQVQFKNKYTGSLTYSYTTKCNRVGMEHVGEHKLGATFDFRMAKRGVLSVMAQYVQIKGTVEQGTSLAYVMMEGMAKGRNAIWNVGYQMSITDYLQLSLQYDGRASEGHRIVHTGNLTIKAQF